MYPVDNIAAHRALWETATIPAHAMHDVKSYYSEITFNPEAAIQWLREDTEQVRALFGQMDIFGEVWTFERILQHDNANIEAATVIHNWSK